MSKRPLQVRINERVADKVYVAHAQEAEEFAAVGVVVAVHRRRVAGRHHVLHAAFKGAAGEHFKPLRLFVVYLVAVDVDEAAIFFREIHAEVDRLDGVFAGKFKMRDRADAVGPHLHRVFHQRLAVGIAFYPLLREGNYLDVYIVFQLFFEFEHPLHRHQRGVGHVDVGADELHAVRGLHLHGAARALLDVVL